jgi:biotin-dependent carboxylase-like uncharacterized protein
MLKVLRAGLLCSVQDLGRDGLTHWGISPSGAADALLLRAGNVLLGNPEGAAAVEITGWGGQYQFLSPAIVTIAGDFSCKLGNQPAPAFHRLSLSAGAVVHVGNARRGFRGYLCVQGGILAPELWGSRSAYLPGGLGGWQGRALREGDLLPYGSAQPLPNPLPPDACWTGDALPLDQALLRITVGQHAGMLPPDTLRTLCHDAWKVLPESNRMGLRLRHEGSGSLAAGTIPGGILSEGVPAGSVQITPSGEPILLGVDAQTTGGYPIAACVISADLRLLGQLRPGALVRFSWVSLEEARNRLMEQETRFYHWKEGL